MRPKIIGCFMIPDSKLEASLIICGGRTSSPRHRKHLARLQGQGVLRPPRNPARQRVPMAPWDLKDRALARPPAQSGPAGPAHRGGRRDRGRQSGQCAQYPGGPAAHGDQAHLQSRSVHEAPAGQESPYRPWGPSNPAVHRARRVHEGPGIQGGRAHHVGPSSHEDQADPARRPCQACQACRRGRGSSQEQRAAPSCPTAAFPCPPLRGQARRSARRRAPTNSCRATSSAP